MNYLDAKTELMARSPRISFKYFAIEAVTLVIVAGLLVRFFT